MLTTPPMQLISMLVFKEKTDTVLMHLAHLGVFQPIDPRRIEKELNALMPLELNAENSQWQALEQHLGQILQKLGVDICPVQGEENFSFPKIKEYFTSLEEKLNILIAERENLRQELKIKERMLSQVADIMPFALRDNSVHTFLEVKLGKLEEKNIVLLEKKLKGVPCVIYPAKKDGNKYVVWLIGLRRDKAFFDNVLADIAWQKMELPQLEVSLPKGGQQQLKSEIHEYQAKLNEISAAIEKLAKLHNLKLSKIQSFITFKKALLEAKRCFRSTDQLVLICGWVPQEEKERVEAEVKKIAKLSYIEKKTVPELDIPKEEVPVRMLHNRLFKPFELLIATYGVPRYGAIDPTFFVAVTFLLMFGAMFGDLGQGLIFVLASFLLRKSKKISLKQAANLLLYCGLSSSVFGLLYGAIFGLEGIIPAFWIKPMENVGQLFNTAITFGILIIATGIVINIVNALRDRDYLKAFFDKAGLIAGVVYFTAIGCVIKLFVSKTKISHFYLILIFFGLVLLFAKPFVEIFFKKDKESESFFVSFMEGIVDIMEIVMGYLANTVSFIRIAAFSLAHAGLFLAIFELSHLLKNVGSGSVSLLVIILGNILIMLLEGLVVTIQSLRLNYYEFFSKFFMYGKQIYKPLTMGSR